MQVTVKTLDSETRVFTVEEEASVEDFKKQIASDVGIPAERQRLIFKGKVLQDSSSLNSYGVDGCVVHLVERKPPTSRTPADGESSSRSTSHTEQGDGNTFTGSFRNQTEVINLSQQIIQGLINQLGLDSAQANVSTSQSGDGSTLNVHINLLASANGGNANDAGARISRARHFLRAARNSLNRAEGEGVLPTPMDTSSSLPRESASNSSTDQQQGSETSQRQNQNGPTALADVLGELQEMNATLQPILARYGTLLRSNSSENLLPSDDSLPDRIAETLHNLSHAYHALSDLTFNFRSPEPRHLNVLPPLSGHVGASPLLSTLFPGMQNPGSQQNQQGTTSTGGSGSRVHIVPAIAFTSVITSSIPRSQGGNHNNPTISGASAHTNQSPGFMFNFGGSGSHGNQGTNDNQRTSASSGTSTTSSSGAHVTTSGGDGVRIVMDDIVALFSNTGQPVTSHSETSRTSTTTPSHGRSQGDTQTQTQNSGTTGTSRVIPRIGLGSLPLNSSHQDPLVPCESFHFGPRAHQPQATQERETTQESQASRDSTQDQGFAQSFSDMIASMIQGSARAGSASSQGATSSTGTNTQENSANPMDSTGQIVQTLMDLLASTQNAPSSGAGNGQSGEQASGQQQSGPGLDLDILQSIVMSSLNEASRGETAGPHQSINDFINQLPHGGAELNVESESIIEGPLLNKLVDRFGMSMSLQDIVFIMLGLSEPYVRIHSVLREYLNEDLLNGEQVSDRNVQRVSSDIASELVHGIRETLTSVAVRDDVDINQSMQSYLQNSVQQALIMARDLDDGEFVVQFPAHVRRSCTDLCVLLIMCLHDGLQGAERLINERLPSFALTRGVHPMILRTFQMTVIQNLNTAYAGRAQREDFLRQFLKKKEPKKEEVVQAGVADQSTPNVVDSSEVNSQHSDDSEAFATPPASLSANDIEEDKHMSCPEENAMEVDPEDGEEWKTIVPEEWVPIITRDVIRQRRVPQQAPFSDAYLSGLPPKRRKTADQRALSSTEENIPSFIRQAVLAAGVTPRTSVEAVATEARQNNDLHGAYREEVKKAVKTRTDKDTDYNPKRFPNTKDYLEES